MSDNRSVDRVPLDGFSSFPHPELRDGFQSSFAGREKVDGSSLIVRMLLRRFSPGTRFPYGMRFSRILRDDEKSEGPRQSDSRVEIVPASGISSELTAHQSNA